MKSLLIKIEDQIQPFFQISVISLQLYSGGGFL
jgi:hypothetical protein